MSGRRTGWEEADGWFRPPPGGGDGEGGAEPPPEEPPGARCEVCGAPLEPDQTYCLECGSPTPLAPRLSRPRAAAMLAAGMAVLGIGAGILAFVLASDDDGRAAPSPTTTTDTAFVPTIPPPDTSGTGPLPPDTSIVPPTATAPPDGTGGLPTDTGGFPTVTGPDPAPPPEPEPEPEPDPGPVPAPSDWPAGRTAWTAILSSVRSESAAQAAKRRVRDAGEPAGVLFSSDHPGMRPGFYVVFSGVFDARSQAIAQATRLRPAWPGAYARRVSG